MLKDDLEQWLGAADFRFAKSMPEMPHWYTLRKNWDSQEAFDAVVEAIREHGECRTFKGGTYTYFDYGSFMYWTMGAPVNKTILINKARR